jgi:hypothetical protein
MRTEKEVKIFQYPKPLNFETGLPFGHSQPLSLHPSGQNNIQIKVRTEQW